jgi:hypothetical protein
MNERSQQAFEERSRALFHDSVDGMDYAMRSRLTQARAAAMEAAAARPRPWFFRMGRWTPAAGMTVAAVLGAFIWLGSPMSQRPVTLADAQNLEDLDMVASSDGNADALDMLQDDIEFYDWADRSGNSGSPATS